MQQQYPPQGYSGQSYPPGQQQQQPPPLPQQEYGGGPAPYAPQYYGGGKQHLPPAAASAAGAVGGSNVIQVVNPDQAVVGEPLYPECKGNRDLDRFVVGEYKDVWAAVLFICQFIAAIVVGAINLSGGKLNTSTGSSSAVTDEFVKGSAVGLGIAVGITLVFLAAMKAFARQFIYICNILFLVAMIAFAVIYFVLGSSTAGTIFVIIAIIHGLWFMCVRRQVPFSSILLENSVNLVMKYWGCIVLAFLSLALALGYYVMWAALALPTLRDLSSGGSTAASNGLTLVFLLMYFWTTVVFQNVVHCTTSGMVATWYFVGENDADMPPSPNIPSFKRAMTTSFGSICFGSLIVAILKVIEYVARSAARGRNGACAAIAYCLISCIERMMEYFNSYAIAHVAIFGEGYIDSAKMTFEFMKRSLWSALINDILIERVFFILSLFEAIVVGVVVYFIFNESWVAAVGGVLCAILVSNIIFNCVNSGVVCLMVVVSEVPEVLNQKHGALSVEINQAMRQMRKGGCCDGGDDDDY